MNKLSKDKRKMIIAVLVEGNSVRATCRLTGVAKGTVLKFIADIGEVCSEYQHEKLRNLSCKRVQCDEIWSYCYAKDKNVPEDKQDKFGYGDIWTYTAICADSKLVPSWYMGTREIVDATVFMQDLASRMSNRIQLTTDGHHSYYRAVSEAFGNDVDYCRLVKVYGKDKKDTQHGTQRYSPLKCTGIKKKKVKGNPDLAHVSTSYVERQNLNMRMNIRRQ